MGPIGDILGGIAAAVVVKKGFEETAIGGG